MTLPSSVTLFPTRRVGGLLEAALPLEGEWQRGLEVGGNGCLAPVRLGPCEVGDAEAQRPSAVATFQPATVRQIVECSALGGTNVGEFARTASEVTIDFALGRELQTGAATNNPALNDATNLGTAALVIEALTCLEADAAAALSGRIAYIHVPPLVSAALPSNLWRDEMGNWRTLAGNIIVVSSGYTGSRIFATGEVYAATETIGTRTFVDRADNTDRGWADRLALAVFDPCYSASIDTGLTCPTPP